MCFPNLQTRAGRPLLMVFNVKIKIALSKDEVRILIKILVGDLGPS